MEDYDKHVMIQGSTAKFIEVIQKCRKCRTVPRQTREYSVLAGNLYNVFHDTKIRCNGDIIVIDAVAANIYEWLQTYKQDKEIKNFIIRMLVTIFNS